MMLASLILLLSLTTFSALSHDLTSSDLSLPYRVKRDQPFETREKVKETFQVLQDTLSAFKDISEVQKWGESAKDILKRLAKFASVAPGCVGVLLSVVNMALAFIPQDDPVLNEVKAGFAEVNRKLDSLSIKISNLATDVEWFNYASVYSQDEVRILNAWRKFNEFRENSELAQNEGEKLRQAEIFINYYEYTTTEASVANLYHYLTVSSTSLSGNLNELLMKKFKCDISEIGKYNFYFSTLLLKGMVLNEAYWKLTGLNPLNKDVEHVQMFKNVYRAQVSAVEFCLKNTEHYVKEDVLEITKANSPDNKEAIADRVKKALDKKYNWYNWVVLVYASAEDGYYTLYDLTKIPVDQVTVAVGHTLKADVIYEQPIKEATGKCFQQCDIENELPGCTFYVDIISPLDDSPSTNPFKEFAKVSYKTSSTDFSLVPPAFVQHSCGYFTRYTVYIHYSRSLSVCRDNTCQNSGTCKRLLDSNDSLCECQDGYYGETCEHRMETSFVKEMNALYPVPTITSTNGRLTMIQSRLEKIANTIDERCPAK
ncbi:cephalotoxin-like protein [Siniperca chuatsi]|uniref:cephalotoxin-like protein n=1 Tax=Siniperca chuatsi TaxID=119488 RepID=UPI001CE21B3F|nr:cephalotoxin-like protein [Siniperca chuatsi]